jgi:hypothetical protein
VVRFEVECEEGVKDVEGQEGDQQEALDCIGIMPVDVVGVPAVDQFVKSVIFDIPGAGS